MIDTKIFVERDCDEKYAVRMIVSIKKDLIKLLVVWVENDFLVCVCVYEMLMEFKTSPFLCVGWYVVFDHINFSWEYM